jgi:hypothetical protein
MKAISIPSPAPAGRVAPAASAAVPSAAVPSAAVPSASVAAGAVASDPGSVVSVLANTALLAANTPDAPRMVATASVLHRRRA